MEISVPGFRIAICSVYGASNVFVAKVSCKQISGAPLSELSVIMVTVLSVDCVSLVLKTTFILGSGRQSVYVEYSAYIDMFSLVFCLQEMRYAAMGRTFGCVDEVENTVAKVFHSVAWALVQVVTSFWDDA